MKATWKPHDDTESLTSDQRHSLPDTVYIVREKRKEPLANAPPVRNAIARFDQVKDLSNHEREQAFLHLKAAAKYFDVKTTETHWQELGKKPHTCNNAHTK